MSDPKRVAGQGRMTPAGYRPANAESYADLVGSGGGRDPLALPPSVLERAGHMRDCARGVVQRYNRAYDTAHDTAARLTQLRDSLCMPCRQDNRAEVRRCRIIDCPAWPYRMGKNPHNPRRGKDPFRG